MGCFFGCFRFKEKERQSGIQANAQSTKGREVTISSSRSQSGNLNGSSQDIAGSAFLEGNVCRTNGSIKWSHKSVKQSEVPIAQEPMYSSNGLSPDMSHPHKAPEASLKLTDLDEEDENRKFNEEVKYLKSCGALLRTPSEIREAAKRQRSPSKDDKNDNSDWHSWFPSPAGDIHWNWQSENSPTTPTPNLAARFLDENHRKDDETTSLKQQPKHSACKEDKAANQYGPASTSQRPSSAHEAEEYPAGVSPMSSKLLEPRICQSLRYDQCPTIDDDNESFSDAGSSGSHDSASKKGNISLNQRDSPTRFEPKTPPLFKSNYSPKPTPLVLTEDMQTPWTRTMENAGVNKNARIRAQYVYPVLNPVENLSQWKELKKGNTRDFEQKSISWTERSVMIENQSISFQTQGSKEADSVTKENFPNEEEINLKRDNSDLIDDTSQKRRLIAGSPEIFKTPKTQWGLHQIPEGGTQSPAIQVDSSLSHWLKTPPVEYKNIPSPNLTPTNSGALYAHKNIEDKPILGAVPVKSLQSISPARSPSSKSSGDYDRPILGLVAAHWNEKQNASPKWWDGKGIPNSTNKYKEDQKVSWHSTPFEERLEKALSNEGVGGRLLFASKSTASEETVESDTAAS